MARAAAFYRGLGYEILFDKTFDQLNDFFGVPPGSALHNINLIKDGTVIPGRVELFKYLGIDDTRRFRLAEQAVPPRIGVLSASFATNDLEAALA
jgi:hypothetical protein